MFQMTAETAGIIGIVIAQVAMFAKMVVDGKTKARESHLVSVEQGFNNVTKRQDEEISRLRISVEKLSEKLEVIQADLQKCELEKISLETRLLLLEKFRNVAANDNPTGDTKRALPPALEK